MTDTSYTDYRNRLNAIEHYHIDPDDPVHHDIWSDVTDVDGTIMIRCIAGRTVTILDIHGTGGATVTGMKPTPYDVNDGDAVTINVSSVVKVRREWPRIELHYRYTGTDRTAVAVFRIPERIRLAGLAASRA